MLLWAKSRQLPLVGGSIALAAVILAFTREIYIPMPVIIGAIGYATASLFAPLVVGVAAAHAFAAKTQSAETRPGWRVRGLDVFLLATITSLSGVAMVIAGGSHPDATGTLGHIAVAVGLSLIAVFLWGPEAGYVASPALFLVTLAYGRDAPGGPYVRVLAPDGDPTWTLALGVVLIVVAAGMILTSTVRTRMLLSERLGGI